VSNETTNVWQDDKGVTVTIKEGKGYEASWFVFRGSSEQVKADLISFFGLDAETSAKLTTFEVTNNARQVAQGLATVAQTIGAVVIDAASNTAAGTPGDDPWAAAASEQAAPADPNAALLSQIAAAASVADLQTLWVDNQGAFSDATVMQAWKDKGKSLTAA
jgi:hypothetical protein